MPRAYASEEISTVPDPEGRDVIGAYEAKLVVQRLIGDDGPSTGLRHFSTRTLHDFLLVVGRVDEDLLNRINEQDGYVSKATLLEEVLLRSDRRTQQRILKGLLKELRERVYQRGPDAFREAEDEVMDLVEQLEERPVAPEGSSIPKEDVWKIIETSETLLSEHGPGEVVDRLHTALHAHTRHVCEDAGIELDRDVPLTRAFKQLCQEHPAFNTPGPVASPERVFQHLGGVLHQLNEARNHRSRAHPTETLPPEDARLFVDAATTAFNFINAKVEAENLG